MLIPLILFIGFSHFFFHSSFLLQFNLGILELPLFFIFLFVNTSVVVISIWDLFVSMLSLSPSMVKSWILMSEISLILNQIRWPLLIFLFFLLVYLPIQLIHHLFPLFLYPSSPFLFGLIADIHTVPTPEMIMLFSYFRVNDVGKEMSVLILDHFAFHYVLLTFLLLYWCHFVDFSHRVCGISTV